MPTERKSVAAASTAANTAAQPSEPELPQYRPISPWAVATLIAGLASPLALIGPLLWFVPLIAIPLAVLAFRQLGLKELHYIGQRAAVAGLCLAALFFGWSVSQRLSREVRIAAEARKFADDWLDLVLAGKLHEAHQLQNPVSRRQSPGIDLASYYQVQGDASKDFESFRANEPVKSLAGKQREIELASDEVKHVADGLTDYFTLRYEIIAGQVPGSGAALWLSCKRERQAETAGADWQITGISLTEPEPLR